MSEDLFGFFRVAAAVPAIKVADVAFNTGQVQTLVKQAHDEQISAVVFPELNITGYSCADLFHQQTLLNASLEAIKQLLSFSQHVHPLFIVGAPLVYQERLYNCAFAIQAGQLLAIVPKTELPNYREFYECRWFQSGADLINAEYNIAGQSVPFGTDILLQSAKGMTIALEICEDLWSTIPPSSQAAINGANVVFNLSASNALVGKTAYRRELVKNQSARCVTAYIYASSGWGESTSDQVYSGHSLIAENGQILAESQSAMVSEGYLLTADIDVQKLTAMRQSETGFGNAPTTAYRGIPFTAWSPDELQRDITAWPFVPVDHRQRDEHCREIFSIQSAGLAQRIAHTGSNKLVIGISGGLDSTLALLVCVEAIQLLGRGPEDIVAVTMPGFGTTETTYNSANDLCKALAVELREINIKAATLQHFTDIGVDASVHDVTYENCQARERTQVLMDLANKHGGLVVGTGDLSEIALGWSTYNGDHMSMYAVNASVPKTLVQYLIAWRAGQADATLAKVLQTILDTPITPELLPSDGQEIAQLTETIIGPYELHDFFLYHALKYGAGPEKIAFLAGHAFAGKYTDREIIHWLKKFVYRFFSQQFKRNCMPDGPKVGSISLSPRADWRMPSDASCNLWIAALEKLAEEDKN